MEQNLYRWAEQAAAELETPGWTGDRDTVADLLDFSREAAHRVARPAAPVTTFIAGVAVGLAGAGRAGGPAAGSGDAARGAAAGGRTPEV